MADENTPWDFPLSFLKIFGFYPNTISKKIIIFWIVYFAGLVFNVCCLIMQIINLDSIANFVVNLEGLGGFVQITGNLSIWIYYRNIVKNLLEEFKMFWKTDLCSAIVKRKLDQISIATQRLLRFVFFIIPITVIIMVIRSLLEKNRLPLGMWTWNSDGYELLYKLCKYFQYVLMPSIAIFVSSFDAVFIVFCAEIIIQFKILQNCMENLKVSNKDCEVEMIRYDRDLRRCIQHHVFLLGYLEKLKKVYSPVMLIMYVTDSPIVCTIMYTILDSGWSVYLIQHIIEFIVQLSQLSYHCIVADILISEAIGVSDAIYKSDWHLNLPVARVSVPFIVQKSQQIRTFSAGNLFDINSSTIVTVMKVSWSACTLMRALKTK